MSMYTQFETSSDFETKGIVLDYNTFRVTIARAGGANKKYEKALVAKSKPYKRLIQTGNLDKETDRKILLETYAETIVLNWETLVDDKYKKGIESKDGAILPFNKANVIQTFLNLPDLFVEIMQQANRLDLFKEEILEEDSKN